MCHEVSHHILTFHFRPRDVPKGTFLLCAFLIRYVYKYTCIRRHLKQIVPYSNITGNEMRNKTSKLKRSIIGTFEKRRPLVPVSWKFWDLFRPEIPVVKLESACFQKVILQHVFHVRTSKRIGKFYGLEPRRCEDINGIVAPETSPKSFGTFEKKRPLGSVSPKSRERLGPEKPVAKLQSACFQKL